MKSSECMMKGTQTRSHTKHHILVHRAAAEKLARERRDGEALHDGFDFQLENQNGQALAFDSEDDRRWVHRYHMLTQWDVNPVERL